MRPTCWRAGSSTATSSRSPIGLGVAAIWGTALLGGLIPQDGVSWQGHFFGAVGGVLAARVFARPRT